MSSRRALTLGDVHSSFTSIGSSVHRGCLACAASGKSAANRTEEPREHQAARCCAVLPRRRCPSAHRVRKRQQHTQRREQQPTIERERGFRGGRPVWGKEG